MEFEENMIINYENIKNKAYEGIDKKYYDEICFKKVISNNNHYIIVMKKINSTTNEDRIVVNEKYAQFRANRLFVIKIFNMITLEEIDEILNKIIIGYYKYELKYITNEDVYPDSYDYYIKDQHTSGIHFFNSLKPAIYFCFNPKYKYFNGNYINFNENGAKNYECEYINDMKHGKEIIYYKNGNKKEECDYICDKKHGKEIMYYENGNKKEECDYIINNKHGKIIMYYENGTIRGIFQYDDLNFSSETNFEDETCVVKIYLT